ncbi:unnamed protein product, partial [Prunus brigantina]
QWLSGLSSLQNLDMSRVDLSKASDWFQVTNTLPSMLVELHMSGCELNQIPVGVANMTGLEVLNLSSIGNLTAIVNLDLKINKLPWKIPNSLGNLCKLTVLGLSRNYFNGSVSEILGSLSRCSPIPVSLGNLSFLEEASISENHFNGTLPKTTGQLKMICEKVFFWDVHLKGRSEWLPLESCLTFVAFAETGTELELRELQGWPNALGCSDHFTTNGDHACSLCKGWFEGRREQIFHSKMKCCNTYVSACIVF